MKAIILILVLVSSIAYAAGPIPQASIRTQDVNDICTTQTSTIRNVSVATKKKVYKLAGVPYGDHALCAGGYEVDHRISLWLGGSNDISNLQLQAYCTKAQLAPNFPVGVLYDARAKDKVETQLHVAVCNHTITPAVAQAKIYNWKN